MNDTSRDFYAAAMAEAVTFVAAGYFGDSPQLAISEADRNRVAEGWAGRTFYNAVNEDLNPKPVRRQETILLVDDDDASRHLAMRMLQSQGYKVLTAVDGRQALNLAGEHPGSIDILLTNVVLSEMSGRQLAEALRLRYPNLKVIFLSGYADGAVPQQNLLQKLGPLVAMPRG